MRSLSYLLRQHILDLYTDRLSISQHQLDHFRKKLRPEFSLNDLHRSTFCSYVDTEILCHLLRLCLVSKSGKRFYEEYWYQISRGIRIDTDLACWCILQLAERGKFNACLDLLRRFQSSTNISIACMSFFNRIVSRIIHLCDLTSINGKKTLESLSNEVFDIATRIHNVKLDWASANLLLQVKLITGNYSPLVFSDYAGMLSWKCFEGIMKTYLRHARPLYCLNDFILPYIRDCEYLVQQGHPPFRITVRVLNSLLYHLNEQNYLNEAWTFYRLWMDSLKRVSGDHTHIQLFQVPNINVFITMLRVIPSISSPINLLQGDSGTFCVTANACFRQILDDMALFNIEPNRHFFNATRHVFIRTYRGNLAWQLRSMLTMLPSFPGTGFIPDLEATLYADLFHRARTGRWEDIGILIQNIHKLTKCEKRLNQIYTTGVLAFARAGRPEELLNFVNIDCAGRGYQIPRSSLANMILLATANRLLFMQNNSTEDHVNPRKASTMLWRKYRQLVSQKYPIPDRYTFRILAQHGVLLFPKSDGAIANNTEFFTEFEMPDDESVRSSMVSRCLEIWQNAETHGILCRDKHLIKMIARYFRLLDEDQYARSIENKKAS